LVGSEISFSMSLTTFYTLGIFDDRYWQLKGGEKSI